MIQVKNCMKSFPLFKLQVVQILYCCCFFINICLNKLFLWNCPTKYWNVIVSFLMLPSWCPDLVPTDNTFTSVWNVEACAARFQFLHWLIITAMHLIWKCESSIYLCVSDLFAPKCLRHCYLMLFLFSVPDEFSFDPVTKTYGEPQRRPEIRSATIEFIAPSEYMVINSNIECLFVSKGPYSIQINYLIETSVMQIGKVRGDVRIKIFGAIIFSWIVSLNSINPWTITICNLILQWI